MPIILLVTILFLSVSCSSVPSKSAVSNASGFSHTAATGIPAFNFEKLDFPVLDAHLHFNKTDKERIQPNADITEELEEAGVVGGVVHLEEGEWKNVEVNRKSKFQFAICAAVVPGETVERLEKGIRDGKYQCLKVYLGYVPKYATDSFYQPFYKLAQRYTIPVVFHTGDTYDKNALVKYADPLPVDEVAVKYPKVTFVLAHMGNPWIHSAAEVVYKNDNVYADTSAFMLEDISKRDPVIVEELVVKPIRWFFIYVDNPKKILFGSDWSLLKIGPYIEAVKRAIPKEHWKAVFHDNAAHVFKLK